MKEDEQIIEQRDFLKNVWQSLWRYFGMKGANKIGLWLLEFEANHGILRCSQSTKEMLITALTLIREINGKRVIISPIKTSGTIKTIKRIKI